MDARLSVHQREDALAGAETKLELAPEGGDTRQRKPENRNCLDEKIPGAGRHAVIQHLQAAKVEDDGRADASDGVEQRKDAGEDQSLPQIHLIRSEEHTSELQSREN